VLGLGLSFARQTAKVFSYVKDSLKAYFRFYDTQPDFLLDGSTSFDGANDYISIADADNLSFGDGSTDSAFSISAWIKMDDATDFQIAGKGIYNSTGEWLFQNINDTLGLYLFDESVASTYELATYDTALTSYEGQWIHVACTYDGRGGTSANAGIKLYLNGSSVATTLGGAGTYVSMENLGANVHIGRYDSAYSEGSIANVGIWSRALSASEVESIYWRGSYSELKDTELTNLVSWYDLQSTTTSDELITNGGFDTDSDWSKGTGWAIADGKATKTAGSANSLVQAINGTVGATYEITFTISDYSAGSLQPFIGGSGASTARSANGTYTQSRTLAGATSIYLYASSTFAGSVDNVSVKELNVHTDSQGSNDGANIGATTNSDSYSGESPFKPRIQDKATPKMAVQLADGSTSFDGTNDYISIADADNLSFGDGTTDSAFSLSAWVKIPNGTDTIPIFHKYSSSKLEYRFINHSSGLIFNTFDQSSSGYIGRQYGTAITAYNNQWIHLVGTYSGNGANSGFKIYLNGSQVDDTNFGAGSYTAMENLSENLEIGRDNGSTYGEFSIANAAIHSRELTQSQVQELMFTEKYSGLRTDLGSDLVTNGDMESGDPPSNWSATQATLDKETTIKNGGSSSLSITHTGGNGMAYQDVTVVSGETYQAKAWVYIASSSAVSNVRLWANSTAGIGSDLSGDSAITTTKDTWVELTSIFTATTTLARIQIRLDQDGEAFADDISLQKLGKDDTRQGLVSWYDLGSTSLGSELVTNGGFDADSNWSKESGWAISGGTANCTTSSTSALYQTGYTGGQTYEVTYTISNRTSGGIYLDSEGGNSIGTAGTHGTLRTANGTYTEVMTLHTGGNLIAFRGQASTSTSLSLDNVSVKAVQVPDSKGSNTGSVYGATTTTGYTHSPHGVVDPLNFGEVYSGRALSFDGSTDYVTLSKPDFMNGESAFTMSAWALHDDTGSDVIITTDSELFMGYNSGKLTASYRETDSTRNRKVATDALNSGEWYHLCATWDKSGDGEIKLYVNGYYVAQSYNDGGASTASVIKNGTSARVGAWVTGSQEMDGKLSSVKVFNTALTQAQVQELYTKPETVLPTGVSASNLKLDLPMQEGSGSYVYDGSGNQNHGTITGATWISGEEYGYQASLVRSNTPMIFDNVNDGVEIPSSPSLQTWNSKATVQAWVYPNSVTDWDGIWGGATGSTGTSFSFGSGNTIKLSSDSGSPTVSSTGTVTLKKWNHVVVSYDGSTAYFYINGSSAGSGSYSQDAVASTNIVLGQYYGISSSTSYKFDGIMNEVAYWDTNLDADAVTQLYNSGVPLLPTSDSGNYDNSDDLQGYWRNDNITTWTDRANTGVASFDGVDDYIADTSVTNMPSDFGVSISSWFKSSSSSAMAIFGVYYSSSANDWLAIGLESGSIKAWHRTASGTSGASLVGSGYADNNWHHCVITYGGGDDRKIYVDGSLVGTQTDSVGGTPFPTGINVISIGRHGDASPSHYFNGQIAGSNLFNVVLTASEISELYAIGKRSSISGHSQFSNCVASYLMGADSSDTTSTIQDQTSNNNDGTVSGASLVGYNDGTASGSPVSIVIPEGNTSDRDSQGFLLTDTTLTSNNGLRMYGGGEVIKLDDSELFHLGTKDFTFEFWAKFNETSTTRGFFNYFKDANNRFHLSNYSNIDFYANVGGSDQSTQISNTRDLDWHHYVVTKESNTMKIYIDTSVVKTNTSWTQDINFTGGTFYIGVRTDDGSDLTSFNVDGSIDEFRIYHKALSSSEVTKNYNNGKSAHQ